MLVMGRASGCYLDLSGNLYPFWKKKNDSLKKKFFKKLNFIFKKLNTHTHTHPENQDVRVGVGTAPGERAREARPRPHRDRE